MVNILGNLCLQMLETGKIINTIQKNETSYREMKTEFLLIKDTCLIVVLLYCNYYLSHVKTCIKMYIL